MQPPHDHPPAARCLRAVHRDHDQPDLLRQDGIDEGDLVLRASAAGGPEELHKTRPLRFEEFGPLQQWWTRRVANEHAWRVPIGALNENFNLDLRHPDRNRIAVRADARALVRDAAASARKAGELVASLQDSVAAARDGGRWPHVPLRELVTVRGGGTPAKTNAAYWDGAIPWISPKDMKVREIFDSADHISTAATTETAAKLIDRGAVLIVVRGMILAHTAPTAVLRVPAAINQDMKALVPDERLSPEYLSLALWARNLELDALTERSTHGTRKLGTERLLDFAIPLPSREEQETVVELDRKLRQQADEFARLTEEARGYLADVMPSLLAQVSTR